MTRYKLIIEYDGSCFFGWQRQKEKQTVQQCIEDAILEITQEHCILFGAGRTDSGVHALGQVAHVDIQKSILPFRLKDALNHFLNGLGISILNVEEVDLNFHARFSACSRIYEYKIMNRRVFSPILRNRVWHVIPQLDISLMQEASKGFIGKHNFQAFRSSECQSKKSIKNLTLFSISENENIITARIEAPSFLHNQVRIMIGTLVSIGRKKMPKDSIKKALNSLKRCDCGPTAPAHGLYFVEVRYKA